MMNKDLFTPSISLWQHYVTIITVGGIGIAMTFDSALVATIFVAAFFAGAAVEGFADARPGTRQ